MKKLDRITVYPNVCLGQPTIRGMRITVSVVLKMLARGKYVQDVLEALSRTGGGGCPTGDEVCVLGRLRSNPRGSDRISTMLVIRLPANMDNLLVLGGYEQPNLITLRLAQSDPVTVTQRRLDTLPMFEKALQEGCAMTIEDATTRVSMSRTTAHLPS